MGLIDRIANRIVRAVQGPPVRERIVVKVVEPSGGKGMAPCFLIGVYRSGTTLLRYVLDSHSNIAVPPETNFLCQTAEIWRSAWVRTGLKGAGVDEEGLRIRLREFAGGVFDDYAAAKGKTRWVDKTPAYIDILDFLDFLFGERCRYIMLYRNGLDVANSLAETYEKKMLGGPPKHYADSMQGPPRLVFSSYWSEECEKMIEFEKAHPSQCFRVLYESYATEPEKQLKPLFEFLGESWDPGVLDFNRKNHDYGLQDSKIAQTKSFDPRIGTYGSWSAEEVSTAKGLIRATMTKLGYEV
ncbi:MAG: sulfotransferase [Deltaproteobacteria bacterium]|nr:sulfotransferase [Deltaproteobacteria bacterium]